MYTVTVQGEVTSNQRGLCLIYIFKMSKPLYGMMMTSLSTQRVIHRDTSFHFVLVSNVTASTQLATFASSTRHLPPCWALNLHADRVVMYPAHFSWASWYAVCISIIHFVWFSEPAGIKCIIHSMPKWLSGSQHLINRRGAFTCGYMFTRRIIDN